MTVSIAGKIEHLEVITSVQRRRRWSAEEKAAIVPGDLCGGDVGVSGGASVRDRAEPAVHLATALCRWRIVGGGGRRGGVAASEYRALQRQVRELQRLLGKTTLENEIL